MAQRTLVSADYGIDAPPVIRNLFLTGAANVLAYGVWQGKEETEEILGLQFGSYIFTRDEERRHLSSAQQSSFHCDSVVCGNSITIALTDVEEDLPERKPSYDGRYQYSASG